MQTMLNYDNEIGTPNKPPRLMSMSDYGVWKWRFESFIGYIDTNLWIPITEGYEAPTIDGSFRKAAPPKPLSQLDQDERKSYDREKKAYSALTMAIPSSILHQFKQYKTSKELWDALAQRYVGNTQLKKSRSNLLKREFEAFKFLKGETMTDLIARFSHLLSEMDEYDVVV